MKKAELELLPLHELCELLEAKGQDPAGLNKGEMVAKLSGKPKKESIEKDSE